MQNISAIIQTCKRVGKHKSVSKRAVSLMHGVQHSVVQLFCFHCQDKD